MTGVFRPSGDRFSSPAKHIKSIADMHTYIPTLNDPNALLDDETIEFAQSLCSVFFRRCHMEARVLEDSALRSIVFGEIGEDRVAVYVRVTEGDDDVEGTGPIPGVLIDAAREFDADPYVIRVHITEGEDCRSLSYFGAEEFEAAMKSDEGRMARQLLRGRTVTDYARRIGRVSELKVIPVRESDPVAAHCEDADSFSVSYAYGVQYENAFRSDYTSVALHLFADDLPLKRAVVSPLDLLKASYVSESYWIHTCDCGIPDCAGVEHPVTVIHQGGLTLWKVASMKPKRICVFDTRQQREAILDGVRRALELFEAPDSDYRSFAYLTDPADLRKALYFAEGCERDGW